MNDNLMQAVDAISASPAIRLRYQILAAREGHSVDPLKGGHGMPTLEGGTLRVSTPHFPPTIEHLREHQGYVPPYDAAAAAARDRSPLAMLIRLRQDAADQIEHLLAFLDATEGGFEDVIDGDEDAAVDDAGCDEDPDEEPALGFVENHPGCWDEGGGCWWPYYSEQGRQDVYHGNSDDREADDSDLEPSLCGVTASATGDGSDLEEENEHGEVANGSGIVDDEPSLCGLGSHVEQGFGNDQDRELAAEPAPAAVESKRCSYSKRRLSNLTTPNGRPVTAAHLRQMTPAVSE